MAWQPTTRLQLSGHRFMRRRIACALLGRDLRAANDSMRAPAQSLTAGLALAIVLLAGCLILAVLRPQPECGDCADRDGKQVGGAVRPVG